MSLYSCKGIKDMVTAENTFQKKFTAPVVITNQDVLSKSPNGNYQLKVSGSSYELGYKTGYLVDSLYNHQEAIFFDKVKDMVGSTNKQRFLMRFLKWYHRDMLDYVPVAYQEEIFGLAQFSHSALDSLATPFQRAMMLHGAHDIGHAMQDLMLVGCSSATLQGNYSEDGSIWMARNFDFYVSDAFAENKLVSFVQPSEGYNYASVSWPGMLGVVSGMNDKGIAVTINAAKSSIPFKAKQPISLIVKEILQYAKNLEEAKQIVSTKQVFVTESILIASAFDNQSIVIELSPKKQDVYVSNNELTVCTNHLQSELFQKDKNNIKHIETSHSQYRYQVITDFLQQHAQVNEHVLAEMLRKTTGIQDEKLGYGNEKALNQLMAHHGVIFHPKTLRVWVSNAPYQLGTFDMYDLNKVFQSNDISPIKGKEIPQDAFIHSIEYQKLNSYRILLKHVKATINSEDVIPLSVAKQLIENNQEYWEAYFWAGRIAFKNNAYHEAQMYFEEAQSKVVTTKNDEEAIEKWLIKCQKKIK